MIYNAYSPTNAHQSHLYVDYVHGLYQILERFQKKYPQVSMMLCSGGGGRIDYGILRYSTEFWPSDNTDGLERIFIQWNYSFFYPSIGMCSHVTNWGKQSLKFRTDVAMMGKLGYDIVVSHFRPEELEFSQTILRKYQQIKKIIFQGDLYRLVSPYQSNSEIASLIYVNENQDQAIWFTYLISQRFQAGTHGGIRLKGLDSKKKYDLEEMNIYPDGCDSSMIISRKTLSGDYLMIYGFDPLVDVQRPSVVLQLIEHH